MRGWFGGGFVGYPCFRYCTPYIHRGVESIMDRFGIGMRVLTFTDTLNKVDGFESQTAGKDTN